MTLGGERRRKSDPKEADYIRERKTLMVQLGENTPVKLGLVGVIVTAIGSAVFWAATIEAQAGNMKREGKETKEIIINMSNKFSMNMKEVSTELRNMKESLLELMHKHELMLERTQIRLKTLEFRQDRMETRIEFIGKKKEP